MTGNTPTASASYTELPLPGSKQAPPKFKGHHRDLERFIEHYKHICVKWNVTDDKQKCLGILRYCSHKVIDIIENLNPYINKDFTGLIQDLQWLYDMDRKKAEYHTGYIEEFTRAWRSQEISSLEVFKQYHREYIHVAGPLKSAGQIDEKDFDRGFWAGLNQETRDKIERRMLEAEPDLDLTVPVASAKIVKGAEHVFSRNRFDKHLREEGRFELSSGRERKSSKKRRHHRKRSSETDNESDSDSESEEETIPWWRKNQAPAKDKAVAPVEPKKQEVVEKSKEADEISELCREMDKLTIEKPKYRSYYIKLSLLAPKIAKLYEQPQVTTARSYISQETRFQTDERPRRDLPPHQTLPPVDQRPPERREYTCYGCGGKGHRMDQCARIEHFLDQGHVKRVMGKLRWTDGSNIIKEPEEAWADAIMRRLQKERVSKAIEDKGKAREVFFVEVAREDSDAESGDQEELGWKSGVATVYDPKPKGVERTTRVSRAARQGVQKGNVPPSPHAVKEFAPRRQFDKTDRKKDPVVKNANFDRSKDRLERSATPTPIDVSPVIFEGKLDGEFVPMDVESPVADKHVQNSRKVTTRELVRTPRDVAQGRTKEKGQLGVIEDILETGCTLSLRELARISPSVRKDLVATLRAIRGTAQEEHDTLREAGKTQPLDDGGASAKVLRTEEVGSGGGARMIFDEKEPREARAELLKVQAVIGDATMTGVIDSGSMVNMISAAKLEESGLPSEPLTHRTLKVTGVNGVTSYCRTWLPDATIYFSKNKSPTYGALYVLEDADFELILGRPFGTYNRVGITEEETGTHVSWDSADGRRYQINASRARKPATRTRVQEVEICKMEDGTEGTSESEAEGATTAFAVRIERNQNKGGILVPDSQEERPEPDLSDPESLARSEEVAEIEKANRLAQERVAKWKREMEEEADDEGGGIDGGDEENEMPPPNQLDKGKRRREEQEESIEAKSDRPMRGKRVRKEREDAIEIGRDLEEDFARMKQTKANRREWIDFCKEERERKAQRDKEWVRWIHDESDDDSVIRRLEYGPSQTLRTREGSEHDEAEVQDSLRQLSPSPETPPAKSTKKGKGAVQRPPPTTTEISMKGFTGQKYLLTMDSLTVTSHHPLSSIVISDGE